MGVCINLFQTLWLNLPVRKGWRQRTGAFLVWEGRPEKQRTLRPAIRASVYHLVPLHKAPEQKRSFNHHEEAWGLRPNHRREERLAMFWFWFCIPSPFFLRLYHCLACNNWFDQKKKSKRSSLYIITSFSFCLLYFIWAFCYGEDVQDFIKDTQPKIKRHMTN